MRFEVAPGLNIKEKGPSAEHSAALVKDFLVLPFWKNAILAKAAMWGCRHRPCGVANVLPNPHGV